MLLDNQDKIEKFIKYELRSRSALISLKKIKHISATNYKRKLQEGSLMGPFYHCIYVPKIIIQYLIPMSQQKRG